MGPFLIIITNSEIQEPDACIQIKVSYINKDERCRSLIQYLVASLDADRYSLALESYLVFPARHPQKRMGFPGRVYKFC